MLWRGDVLCSRGGSVLGVGLGLLGLGPPERLPRVRIDRVQVDDSGDGHVATAGFGSVAVWSVARGGVRHQNSRVQKKSSRVYASPRREVSRVMPSITI